MTLRAARWLFALLAIAVVLGGIDNLGRKLAHPDEGRYSEISRGTQIEVGLRHAENY